MNGYLSVAKKLCGDYVGGRCLVSAGPCLLSIKGLPCRYFERAVLPNAAKHSEWDAEVAAYTLATKDWVPAAAVPGESQSPIEHDAGLEDAWLRRNHLVGHSRKRDGKLAKSK